MTEQLGLHLFPPQHHPLSIFAVKHKSAETDVVEADFVNDASTRLVFYRAGEVVEAFLKSNVANSSMVGRTS